MKIKLPNVGDTRIQRKFLWLPLVIEREMRWLVKASWMQRYTYDSRWGGPVPCWKDERWLD
jgi:hypothetical protein